MPRDIFGSLERRPHELHERQPLRLRDRPVTIDGLAEVDQIAAGKMVAPRVREWGGRTFPHIPPAFLPVRACLLARCLSRRRFRPALVQLPASAIRGEEFTSSAPQPGDGDDADAADDVLPPIMIPQSLSLSESFCKCGTLELWNFGEQNRYCAASIGKTAYTGNEFQSSKVPKFLLYDFSPMPRYRAPPLWYCSRPLSCNH